MTVARRFAAFDNRNFRRYFLGQTISSVGSWTQTLAVTWLVLDLTDRSDQLGVAMASPAVSLLTARPYHPADHQVELLGRSIERGQPC